jgi:orotate phosphoribosyltransferase
LRAFRQKGEEVKVIRSEAECREIFREAGAFWLHDGNPARPHPILTSGRHSSGYFNAELVTQDPALLNKVCILITDRLRDAGFTRETLNRIVGPERGGRLVSYELASILTRFSSPVFCGGVYKDKDGRLTVLRNEVKDEKILLADDVLTTGNSVLETEEALHKSGASVMGFVCVLMNRSGMKKLGNMKIIAALTHHLPEWLRVECPLCENGSVPLRPKENWKLFARDYGKE